MITRSILASTVASARSVCVAAIALASGCGAPMPMGDASEFDARVDVAPGDAAPADSFAMDTSSDGTPVVDVPAGDTSSADTVSADTARSDVPGVDAIGGTDAGGPNASRGCGMPAGAATATWVARTITVAGAMRSYWVRLPTGYDPRRAYPIVYQFHGCSSSATREDNNVPVQNASGAEAIHVRARAASTCWDTATAGADIPYIDAMIASVEASWCVDTGRRFAAGYSSGSFMTHRLGCIRGALFRGVASVAGGQPGTACTGNVAALLIHDTTDPTVPIMASVQTRDNHVMRNGCNATAPRTPTTHPPCEAYAGCTPGLPVVWCQTTGMAHGRQDAFAAPTFWDFFNGLPRR